MQPVGTGATRLQSPATPWGSGSVRVTPLAVPVPAALLLATVMSKTTSSPALMFWAFGVLVMVRSGFWQVTWPGSEPLGWLVEVKLAVLL